MKQKTIERLEENKQKLSAVFDEIESIICQMDEDSFSSMVESIDEIQRFLQTANQIVREVKKL